MNCGFLQCAFYILNCSDVILCNISKYHLNQKLFHKTKLSFKRITPRHYTALLRSMMSYTILVREKSGTLIVQSHWSTWKKEKLGAYSPHIFFCIKVHGIEIYKIVKKQILASLYKLLLILYFGVVMVSLFLTLNIFHTLFQCFYC